MLNIVELITKSLNPSLRILNFLRVQQYKQQKNINNYGLINCSLMINHCNWWEVKFNLPISSKKYKTKSVCQTTASRQTNRIKNSRIWDKQKTDEKLFFCAAKKKFSFVSFLVDPENSKRRSQQLLDTIKKSFFAMKFFHSLCEKKSFFCWWLWGFCVHKSYVLNTLCTTTFHGTTFRKRENSITSTVQSRPRNKRQWNCVLEEKRGKSFVTQNRIENMSVRGERSENMFGGQYEQSAKRNVLEICWMKTLPVFLSFPKNKC